MIANPCCPTAQRFLGNVAPMLDPAPPPPKLDRHRAETFHHLVAMGNDALPVWEGAAWRTHHSGILVQPQGGWLLGVWRSYLWANPDLKLTLEVNPSKVLEWWVDALHRRPGKNNFFDILTLYNITVRQLNFLLNAEILWWRRQLCLNFDGESLRHQIFMKISKFYSSSTNYHVNCSN